MSRSARDYKALPEPSFIDRNADAILEELIALYEKLTGKTLYPAQPERALVNTIAYREVLIREVIQDSCLQNLVRFARAPVLDFLGENVGAPRLESTNAKARFQFIFNPAPNTTISVPAGTRISDSSGGIVFATKDSTVVTAGTGATTVIAVCEKPGAIGNGFAIGQINKLVDTVNGLSVTSASNIEITDGGGDQEDDARYRERIILAPGRFSTAGSEGSYRFYALGANRDITQVAILSDYAGSVQLYPLTRSGLPSQQIKDQVYAACNAKDVRPLTDYVTVHDPEVIPWELNIEVTTYLGADETIAYNEAFAAANGYKSAVEAALGKDLVPSQISDELHVYGVYRVNVISPTYTKLQEKQWAKCTSVTVTLVGQEVG